MPVDRQCRAIHTSLSSIISDEVGISSFIFEPQLIAWSVEYPNVQLDTRAPVVNVGNRENPSYLPAEVCQALPGQPIKRRLSPEQTQGMISFACRKPFENAESIVGDGKAVLGLNPSANSIAVCNAPS